MRISEKKSLRIYCYAKNGDYVGSIYDSGFSSLGGILFECERRFPHADFGFISIVDINANESSGYRIVNRRFVLDK